MVFTRDGITLSVSDRAHIDCLKAKGWQEVKIAPKTATTKTKTARRKNDA